MVRCSATVVVPAAALAYLCLHIIFIAPEQLVWQQPGHTPGRARTPAVAQPSSFTSAAANVASRGVDLGAATPRPPVPEAAAVGPAPADEPAQDEGAELVAWFERHNVRIPAGNDLSQEWLYQTLLPLWGTRTPRVMVDLGSHPAFGDVQQYNDALIFMEYFHAGGAGGAVLAVDAVPDFAEDVRLRMHGTAPYGAMVGVKRVSVAAWVGNADAYLTGAPNRTVSFARQMGYCLSGHSFDHLVKYCELERAGRPEHMCRVTRRRLGIVCEPGSSGAQPAPAVGYESALRAPVEVQQRSVESLWRRELGGAHIDLLKVDIDIGWDLYGEGMGAILRERAASLMVIEIDRNWRQLLDGRGARPSEVVEEFVGLLAKHGYVAYLKVPCAIAVLRSCRRKPLREGRCSYNAPRNRTVGLERLLRLPPGAAGRLPHALKLQQDLLAVDSRQTELVAALDRETPPCPGPAAPLTRPRSLTV